MQQNDLKFFTNEPDRDLYSRFSNILKSNTQFFDILVGYFRASGFYRMYEAMENVEKIRILVGLNVDKYTVKIIDKARSEVAYEMPTMKEAKEFLAENVEDEFNKAETTSSIEQGVRTFIEWLKKGKLEMRMYVDAPIHAKVYIMRKDQEKVPDTFGTVITGSSNFSEAGLQNNLEFNVELKDSSDVHFALDKFEELWVKGVPINEEYIEAVEKRTWFRNDIYPYEIYLKTLYEFFKACYENALDLALKNNCESIAFPLIATGSYGFPKDKALQIATAVIQQFLFENEMTVILVVFDRKAFELSGKVFSDVQGYIDENYVERSYQREYERSHIAGSVMLSGLRRRGTFPRDAKELMPDALEADEMSLDKLLDSPAESFREKLFQLIDKSGLDDVAVYKKANITKKVFFRYQDQEKL